MSDHSETIDRRRFVDPNVYVRVGGRPRACLEWLIRFNGLNLNRLKTQEWERLQADITAFVQMGILDMQRCVTADDIRWLVSNVPQSHMVVGAVPKPIAGCLQRISASCINDFIEQGSAALPRACFTRRIVRVGARIVVLTIPDDITGPFFNYMARLLGEEGSNICKCDSPTCGNVFMRVRSTKRYCSDKCRALAHVRLLRKKTAITTTVKVNRASKKRHLRGGNHGKKRRH
jgi:hypothetical protein